MFSLIILIINHYIHTFSGDLVLAAWNPQTSHYSINHPWLLLTTAQTHGGKGWTVEAEALHNFPTKEWLHIWCYSWQGKRKISGFLWQPSRQPCRPSEGRHFLADFQLNLLSHILFWLLVWCSTGSESRMVPDLHMSQLPSDKKLEIEFRCRELWRANGIKNNQI